MITKKTRHVANLAQELDAIEATPESPGVKMFFTARDREDLAALGYSKEQVYTMNYADGAIILGQNVVAPAATDNGSAPGPDAAPAMPDEKDSLLTWALGYAELGIYIHPCYALTPQGHCTCRGGKRCPTPGKHPLIKDYEHHSSIDPAQISEWWRKWPNANIGLNTRKNNLVVLDIDPRNDGDTTWATLQDTLEFSTDTPNDISGGGGAHYYYRVPDGVKPDNLESKLGAGVDVLRASKCNVIIAPSHHASGNRYEWALECSPWDVPFTPLPGALLAALQKTPVPTTNGAAPKPSESITQKVVTIATLLLQYGNTDRHYDEWLDVGLVCYHELGAAGLPLWVEWSEKSKKHSPGLCEAKWPTFATSKERKLGIGSLVLWVKNDGGTDKTRAAGSLAGPLPLPAVRKYANRGQQGHAELLTACFGERACYDNAAKSWYTWTGERWERDTTGLFYVLAANQLGQQYSAVVADLYKQAATADADAAKTLQKDAEGFLKIIKALRSRTTITNVLQWAQASPNLGIFGDEWDKCPGKLPCKNGVVDLATGDFEPMTPGDYMQKVAPVGWDGLNADAPRWKRFISEIFNGDTALITFVQRLLGCALLGEAKGALFPIFWGSGGNGKSTLCRAIEDVMGPLGGAAHKAIITSAGRRANPNAAQPFLMDLRGKRFAFVSEPDKAIKIDEAQVKLITGGDNITARYLNENPVTFSPTHTVFLLTNPKPALDADDAAMWRRVFLIPFTQTFTRNIDLDKPKQKQANPDLGKELLKEGSGILAWLVRGSLAYRQHGLKTPAIVRNATKEYRSENDTFSMWVKENCEPGTTGAHKVKSSSALQNYKGFCEEQGLEALSTGEFRAKMKAKFGPSERLTAGMFYKGVKVLWALAGSAETM